MSEKTNKGSWITSAANIDMDAIDTQLFRADSVEDFLENKSFIIAEKGIGKTLLLKKKKYDLLQKEGAILIPSGREDLDIPADFNYLTKNQISFLEQENKTKSLWSLAIIKKRNFMEPENNFLENALEKDYLFMIEQSIKMPSWYNIQHWLFKINDNNKFWRCRL